jgi:hypothetical protein
LHIRRPLNFEGTMTIQMKIAHVPIFLVLSGASAVLFGLMTGARNLAGWTLGVWGLGLLVESLGLSHHLVHPEAGSGGKKSRKEYLTTAGILAVSIIPTLDFLAFPAMLMAGLDGIQKKIDPGQPADFNLYEADAETAKKIKTVPGSLGESLEALEADHEFLLAGDVFTKDVIETWIEYKRIHEADPVRLRPHPYEFFLYYDV